MCDASQMGDFQVCRSVWGLLLASALMNLIHRRIGAQFAPFIKTRFEEINGQTVCVVDVDKAPEPVFMDGQHGKEFHMRLGNTTRELNPEETVRYVQTNWG